MMTTWGETLSADNVWPEYPRPQMVRTGWQNLNGYWHYAVRPQHEPQPTSWDGEILVPFCIESALSGVRRRFEPTERLWYRRSVVVDRPDERTIIHLGAVDHHCAIWLNGAFVGAHSGGFDAFSLDLTLFLRSGGNELVIAVDDPSSSGEQPRGKQHLRPQGIWYTPVTGIWQTVWLEQVPLANHIDDVRIVPTPDCNGVTVEVLLARPTRDPELAVELVVRQASAVVSSTLARPDRRVLIAIADPEVWTPSSPSLYDLDVRLLRVNSPLPTDTANLVREVPLRGDIEAARYANVTASGRPLDEVRCYFGLRHIELGAHPDSGHPTLLLNGTPEFQLGTLDQGWWPDGLHTPPSDAAMIHEIEFLKAAGFNTIRKHIKVEPARYYYHCDRLGLLVWQDMPSGFLPAQFVAPNDQNEGLRRSSSTADYEHELQQMIRGLRCHPCIVVWVLHNEGWGQFDTHRLSELIKLLDPTRVVDAVSGWLDLGAGDLIDRHDYEPTPAPPAPDGRRALVIGEYGGIGWPIDGHLWDPEMRNWGYQTFHHAAAFEQAYTQTTAAIIDMYRNHNLCAAIYTQTTDVEGEVNGLLSYDRKVEKLPREWFAGVHAPLR